MNVPIYEQETVIQISRDSDKMNIWTSDSTMMLIILSKNLSIHFMKDIIIEVKHLMNIIIRKIIKKY